MGIKRLSRSRLAASEKKGINIVTDIGEGMEPALISATQMREGRKVITDIVLDFGTSKGAIISGGSTADNVCGVSAKPARICKLAGEVFGTITEIRTVCLEAPAGINLTDLNICTGDNGDGQIGTNAQDTGTHAVIGALKDCMAAVGTDKTVAYDAQDVKNKYLYLACGDTAAGVTAQASCEISGIPADLTNIGDALTQIQLGFAKGAGGIYTLVADTTSGTPADGKIDLNTVTGKQNIANAIKTALDREKSSGATHGLTGVVSEKPAASGEYVVTVTQDSTTGANGNTSTNAIVDAAGKTSGIATTQYSGGATGAVNSDGTSATFTAGKLLIRVTGFKSFDDK